MRRGRVPVASQPAAQPPRKNPSPAKVTNGDPFAALDSKAAVPAGDELSSRFPTLDQFAILHDHGSKFEFDSPLSPTAATAPTAPAPTKDLSQRLAERLADNAFQVRPSASSTPPLASQRQPAEASRPRVPAPNVQDAPRVSPPLKSASAPPRQPEMSRASAIISSMPELQAISSQVSQPVYAPPAQRPTMVSTGTNTTPPPEGDTGAPYQIHRFPPADDRHRTSSLPRQPEPSSNFVARGGQTGSRTPSLQAQAQPALLRHPSSSRPSLEGGRPNLDQLDPGNPKHQLSSRPRPVSTHLESNLDYLREREAHSKPQVPPAQPSPRYSIDKDLPPPGPEEETNIESNVEFLRAMEDSDPKRKEGSKKHHHHKRSSLTSLGAGTKNILVGKFGDAFKRFEGSGPPPPRTPSPLKELGRRDLTPIAGSEATDGRSDDGMAREYEDTPEMRREQEARMLAQEEARVAAAQVEYRQRVAQRGPVGSSSTGATPLPKSIGGVSRAVSIQNKVQSLLDESNRPSTVTRTAQGYGPYSDAALPARPAVPPKPLASSVGHSAGSSQRAPNNLAEPPVAGRMATGGGRPMAPPKPTHLNKNLTSGGSLPGRPASPLKPLLPSSSVAMPRTNLVAVDLPGQPVLEMTAAEKDDYLRDFQKRYPSLTALEILERDQGAEEGSRGR